jgi:four helix bundle protein
MPTFGHQKLDVYQVAIDFVAVADDVVERLPRGRAYLADQLQRAAVSVPLNIAEGAGEFSRNDKRRFYRMALRSATEAAAILDVCARLKLAEPSRLASGMDLLDRIVAMLTRMIRAQSKSQSGAGGGAGGGNNPHGHPGNDLQDSTPASGPAGTPQAG